MNIGCCWLFSAWTEATTAGCASCRAYSRVCDHMLSWWQALAGAAGVTALTSGRVEGSVCTCVLQVQLLVVCAGYQKLDSLASVDTDDLDKHWQVRCSRQPVHKREHAALLLAVWQT